MQINLKENSSESNNERKFKLILKWNFSITFIWTPPKYSAKSCLAAFYWSRCGVTLQWILVKALRNLLFNFLFCLANAQIGRQKQLKWLSSKIFLKSPYYVTVRIYYYLTCKLWFDRSMYSILQKVFIIKFKLRVWKFYQKRFFFSWRP